MMEMIDSGIRLQALLLADHANVREGLLNVLSAGITRANLGQYPGNLAAYLVLVVYLPADQVGLEHEAEIVIKYPETAREAGKIGITFRPDGERNPGEGLYVPLIVPTLAIVFPEPGQVDIQVSLDRQPANDLTIWLIPPDPV